MRDEPLLEALEVEIPAVPQQLRAVHLAADGDGIAAQQVQQLGEDVRAAALDRGREDGRRAQQAVAVEAREEVAGGGEEGGEAEGEVVGRVARVREEVARDAELAAADRRKDGFLVELGDEFGDCFGGGVC